MELRLPVDFISDSPLQRGQLLPKWTIVSNTSMSPILLPTGTNLFAGLATTDLPEVAQV